MRREFQLSKEDEEGLNALGLDWEAILQDKVTWIIIYGYPMPIGFTNLETDVALRIPSSYPDEQIDMAYFLPIPALKNGRIISKLTGLAIDGKTYQQWSRHRSAANPWRAGVDNIATHLLQITAWLEQETNI